MFIKKDLRKIDEILDDDGDERNILKLSKRAAEFNGNVSILCSDIAVSRLMNLRTLNLYDNHLSSVEGIGALSCCPLEEINLGCNELKELPLEFGRLSTITSLWLDDNHFTTFPICLTQLLRLRSLRLSGNDISSLPDALEAMTELEILVYHLTEYRSCNIAQALDNNNLMEFPSGVTRLYRVTALWLRQNHITEIPDDIQDMMSLVTLSLSSNKLVHISSNIGKLSRLENLYVNSNVLSSLPEELCSLHNLKELNIANNNLSTLPGNWIKHLTAESSERVQVDTESGSGKFELVFLGNNFWGTTMEM